MGRYIKDIQLEQPIDVVSMVMDDFIYHNHFTRTDWNGEMVFYLKDRHKKERYLKWVYVDGKFHVEAWLKNSLGGETDLDGVGGGASRKEFRASIDGLIETLKKTAAGSVAGGHIGSDPLHHDDGHADNHDRWKADTQWQQGQRTQAQSTNRTQSAGRQSGQYRNQPAGQRQQGVPYQPQPAGGRQGMAGGTVPNSGNTPRSVRDPEANTALIYSILAVLFGWSFFILGIVFIVMAKRKEEYSSHPGAVKILCIIAVVEMILAFAFNVFAVIVGSFL